MMTIEKPQTMFVFSETNIVAKIKEQCKEFAIDALQHYEAHSEYLELISRDNYTVTMQFEMTWAGFIIHFQANVCALFLDDIEVSDIELTDVVSFSK